MSLHCTNCGAELLPDAKFCASCGTKTGTSPLGASLGSDTAMNIGIIALGGLLVGGFLYFAMRPKTPAPPAPKTVAEAKVIPTEAAPLAPANQIGLSAPPQGAVSADVGANQVLNPNAQIAATGAPMAATTYYVASRQVNLRAAPNPNAQIIARLPFRTGMVATKQQTFIDPSTSIARVWVFVTVGTQSGWVNSTLISQTPFNNPIDGQASASPQNTRAVWDANCVWVSTNKLNIRSSANPNSSVVIRVPYGTSLDCSGNLNAYVYPNTGERTEWMHVRYNGHVGWANVSYLSTY
ncbi:MAG: hypothetical protein FD163_1427 [Hyphomonadaceae bacterium]|nr:MAG: hypothetical protein FD128_313 [Hyphomonadaceae bacterium]KAF0184730.1 MAG: hypothetical protein FD163_1427 [Hyphomonadaceae bacterium]